jgi:Flp pilus assembly pilin Flp
MLSRINDMLLKVWDRVRAEAGQAMPEYGLLVALIAVVAILATTAIGLGVSGKFDDIANAISGAGS